MTAGVSPSALFQAYTDWAQHLLFSPDKQMELVEQAFHDWMHFLEYCPKALLNPDCEACVELAPNDKRFSSAAWQHWPFNAYYQSFLLGSSGGTTPPPMCTAFRRTTRTW